MEEKKKCTHKKACAHKKQATKKAAPKKEKRVRGSKVCHEKHGMSEDLSHKVRVAHMMSIHPAVRKIARSLPKIANVYVGHTQYFKGGEVIMKRYKDDKRQIIIKHYTK